MHGPQRVGGSPSLLQPAAIGNQVGGGCGPGPRAGWRTTVSAGGVATYFVHELPQRLFACASSRCSHVGLYHGASGDDALEGRRQEG